MTCQDAGPQGKPQGSGGRGNEPLLQIPWEGMAGQGAQV